MHNIFFEISLIIIIATLFGYLMKLLRQPIIPAYIISGLIIGPVGFGLITDHYVIKTLAEIGIAFLLFVVGLELDFRRLKDIGLVASIGGTAKTLILFGLGFLVALLLGVFSVTEALYLGLILAFSSTMVVVKLLSDKKELDSLHGRIIIGILLMEDILAITALSLLTSLESISMTFVFISLIKVAFRPG